jgi:hypothetical protein
MASFEEILNMPGSEIKPPAAYPVGTYHCIIDGPPENGQSSQKGTDYFRFKYKILGIDKDVNPQEAAEQQVVGKVFTSDFYVADGITWRLTEMLVNCGIDEKLPLKQMIAEAPGKQLWVKLRHEPSQDGKRVFHRLDSTAHV